ncbi:P-type ATPase N-terminal [Trinorchestia longiramus]|nr:P-type ATPase N-terminal [Trinorchestia longiramus]
MATSGGDGADISSYGGDFVPPAGGGRGAKRRTHARSASHGGTAWSHSVDVSYSPHDSRGTRFHHLPSGPSSHAATATPSVPTGGRNQDAAGQSSGAPPGSPPHSILMNPNTGAAAVRSHHRTFSHGQTIDGVTGPHQRGHRRAGSRTDFILPDGHEQRQRERQAAAAVAAKPSLGRTSSFPLGHKRNASKTESIYTIRENKISLLQRLLIFLGKSLPVEVSTRTVVLNHTQSPGEVNPNDVYPSNRVTTTKYNALTFIPKNLFEQFHRFANIYFLFIVLLNFVPSINAFAKEVAMLPLLFVLSVTALKDLFEDRRRYNSDKRVNNSVCRVYCRSVRCGVHILYCRPVAWAFYKIEVNGSTVYIL